MSKVPGRQGTEEQQANLDKLAKEYSEEVLGGSPTEAEMNRLREVIAERKQDDDSD